MNTTTHLAEWPESGALTSDTGEDAEQQELSLLPVGTQNCAATTAEPAHLEPVLRNKRGRDSERPARRDEERPLLAATGESTRTETKTQHSNQSIKKKKKLVQPLWKTVEWFLTKLHALSPCDPAVSFLGIYPEELKTCVHTKTCTRMFIELYL